MEFGIGALEESRAPNPQIRSLVSAIEIIEVRYRKQTPSGEFVAFLALSQWSLLPKKARSALAHIAGGLHHSHQAATNRARCFLDNISAGSQTQYSCVSLTT